MNFFKTLSRDYSMIKFDWYNSMIDKAKQIEEEQAKQRVYEQLGIQQYNSEGEKILSTEGNGLYSSIFSLQVPKMQMKVPEIKEVMVHYPATIVFWKDGTKTVTKPHGNDEWCMETAIAMAFMKKMFGRSKYLEKVAYWEKRNKKNLKDLDKQIEKTKEERLKPLKDYIKDDTKKYQNKKKEKINNE